MEEWEDCIEEGYQISCEGRVRSSKRDMLDDGMGNSEIGHLFGVTCGCIYSIRKGKSWAHIK